MSNQTELRELLITLLCERKVERAAELVGDLEDTGLHGALAVIREWDAAGHDSTGLLVHQLRHSNLAAYRRPGERKAAVEPGEAAGAQITPRLIRSIRAGCSTPDGINRAEARGMYDTAARAFGVPADKLIDMAMGEGWYETPKTTVYDNA